MTILYLVLLSPSMSLDDAIAAAIRIDVRNRAANVQVEQTERGETRAVTTIFGPRAAATATGTFQQEIAFMNQVIQPNVQGTFGGQITVPLYAHEYWGRRDQAKYSTDQSIDTRSRTRE